MIFNEIPLIENRQKKPSQSISPEKSFSNLKTFTENLETMLNCMD